MDITELLLLRPIYMLVDTISELSYWKSVLVLLTILAYLWILCHLLLASALVLSLVTAILVLVERRDLLQNL